MKPLALILTLFGMYCSDNIAKWEAEEKMKTYILMKNRIDIPCIEAMPCDINWCGPDADPNKPCKVK